MKIAVAKTDLQNSGRRQSLHGTSFQSIVQIQSALMKRLKNTASSLKVSRITSRMWAVLSAVS